MIPRSRAIAQGEESAAHPEPEPTSSAEGMRAGLLPATYSGGFRFALAASIIATVLSQYAFIAFSFASLLAVS
jgi:hypothetical protein